MIFDPTGRWAVRRCAAPLPARPRGARPAGRRSGFTLIELMLTLAIVGVLATVAIPMLLSYQFRAKAAEAATNMGSIQKALEAYYAEYNVYVSAMPPTPASVGAANQPWGLASSTPHGFNSIGYVPEGLVYFQYGVTSDGSKAYTIAARSDLDGDGNYRTWGFVKPSAGSAAGVVGPFATCAATGVLDPVTLLPNRLRLLGPCDLPSGASEY